MEPRRIRSASERSVMCIVFSMLPWASFWTKRMSMTRMTPRFRTRRSSAMMRPVASNLSKPMTKTWIGPVTCLSLMFVLLSVVGGRAQRPTPCVAGSTGVGPRRWQSVPRPAWSRTLGPVIARLGWIPLRRSRIAACEHACAASAMEARGARIGGTSRPPTSGDAGRRIRRLVGLELAVSLESGDAR